MYCFPLERILKHPVYVFGHPLFKVKPDFRGLDVIFLLLKSRVLVCILSQGDIENSLEELI